MIFDPRAKAPKDPELEKQGAIMFGKHVSKEKGIILLIFTLIACALPLIFGLRMWDSIPEVISSGRTFPNGKEDAIPRWVMVYGFPAFFCLLNVINHIQLAYHQKEMALPPTHIRIMGRFGFTSFSVLFCVGMVCKATGQRFFQLQIMAPAAVGWLLMMLGAHMYDCKINSRISLAFCVAAKSQQAYKALHRFAGICWLAGGVAIIAAAMMIDNAAIVCIALLVIFGAAPIVYGKTRA